jgi:cysteinyl-tRNA synthetase
VQSLLKQRQEARDKKNWELSDSLRVAISEAGYSVEDRSEGQVVKKK